MEKFMSNMERWIERQNRRERRNRITPGLLLLYVLGMLVVFLQLRSLIS